MARSRQACGGRGRLKIASFVVGSRHGRGGCRGSARSSRRGRGPGRTTRSRRNPGRGRATEGRAPVLAASVRPRSSVALWGSCRHRALAVASWDVCLDTTILSSRPSASRPCQAIASAVPESPGRALDVKSDRSVLGRELPVVSRQGPRPSTLASPEKPGIDAVGEALEIAGGVDSAAAAARTALAAAGEYVGERRAGTPRRRIATTLPWQTSNDAGISRFISQVCRLAGGARICVKLARVSPTIVQAADQMPERRRSARDSRSDSIVTGSVAGNRQ